MDKAAARLLTCGMAFVPLLAAALSLALQPANGEAWRGIEGVWRVAEGERLCPGGEIRTYAFSDDGANLVLWAQGYLVEPVTIPDRLGRPPRIQGRNPFDNTRILSRQGAVLRNRYEALTVEGDRLTVDYGNFRCRATRVRN